MTRRRLPRAIVGTVAAAVGAAVLAATVVLAMPGASADAGQGDCDHGDAASARIVDNPTATPASTVPAQAGTVPTATPSATAASGSAVNSAATATTLVLYDSTGDGAWFGEVYATQAANLVSHFGSWTAHPVRSYAAGELSTYSAVIYIGSTYDEPVPVAFLDDVLAARVPVVWVNDNIWQLTARHAGFATVRGFMTRQFDLSSVAEVRYGGTSLTRDASEIAGIMDTVVLDPTKASTVGEAVRADGTTFPWAVRSGNLTYIGEIPFTNTTADDRYLAFSDLLFDAIAPTTASRHRALVRIEDVGPKSDPADLRAVADYLSSRHVPFTVAVYPRYLDPTGDRNNGTPEDLTLRCRPEVVSALKYMLSRGGTLLMHGYTHQYGGAVNPYDAVSGSDFEFFLAHVDASNSVVYDGPVTDDSPAFVSTRVSSATREFELAGLDAPTMFEFPHYAASSIDYQAVNQLFRARYDRGIYFPGLLSGTTVDHSRIAGQFFPYAVRDVYGSVVVPENVGNVTEAYNNHPARLPADLVASASRNLAVRDGVASFFYHPYLGTRYLQQIVEGVQGLGYTFVPASAMLTS